MSRHDSTLADNITTTLKLQAQRLWAWARGPGRHAATVAALTISTRIRVNLSARRLLSFPHALLVFWVVILLWGERWVFDSKVARCDWDHWEDWVSSPAPLSFLCSSEGGLCLDVY